MDAARSKLVMQQYDIPYGEDDNESLFLVAENSTDFIGDYYQKTLQNYYYVLGTLDMTEHAELYIL